MSNVEQEAAQLLPKIRELDAALKTAPKTSRDVTISIDVQAVGAVIELELQYVVHSQGPFAVPPASWTASYDIRINSDEQTMVLVYYALVKQNTGEVCIRSACYYIGARLRMLRTGLERLLSHIIASNTQSGWTTNTAATATSLFLRTAYLLPSNRPHGIEYSMGKLLCTTPAR
jgi:hypothetical protein